MIFRTHSWQELLAACVVLQRKLVIYNTLKNEWVFEDIPNFVLAES